VRFRSLFPRLCLSIFSIVFLLFLLEFAAKAAVSLGWLIDQPPMITVLPPGTDDWREAHMTADGWREPDPVLWWRSKTIPPYNKQGFKGAIATIPKPQQTLRIIIYGDSNTEGLPKDSWPERLQQIFNQYQTIIGMKCEVLNAGVAGYTSHQGLLRMQQEISTYQPDLIFVSFGWNDTAEAFQPDSKFRAPSDTVVFIERILLKRRFYRVLKHYIKRNPDPGVKKVPRVSVEEYTKNVKQFHLEAKEHGAIAVVFTRPHRDSIADLQTSQRFMRRVPEYNQRLLELCKELNDSYCIDAEDYFLQNYLASDWIDECHFTEKGRIKMAEYVFSQLQHLKLLNSRSNLTK
jgi:lysophospholipase L1-like esterase